ncbi:MAG: WD40 repeat domain-containing protein [Deltaproteobacteria bacterium]|nr:WD40 repeat domain-containing protein [Deltaproteobacteria bacterium]
MNSIKALNYLRLFTYFLAINITIISGAQARGANERLSVAQKRLLSAYNKKKCLITLSLDENVPKICIYGTLESEVLGLLQTKYLSNFASLHIDELFIEKDEDLNALEALSVLSSIQTVTIETLRSSPNRDVLSDAEHLFKIFGAKLAIEARVGNYQIRTLQDFRHINDKFELMWKFDKPSQKGIVQLLDFDRNLVSAIQVSNKAIRKLAFSNDGNYLAAEDADHVVRVYEVADWNLLFELHSDRKSQPIYFMSFDVKSQNLIMVEENGIVRAFDVCKGKRSLEADFYSKAINAAAVDFDSNRIVLGFTNGLKLVDLETKKVIRSWPTGSVHEVELSENGKEICFISRGREDIGSCVRVDQEESENEVDNSAIESQKDSVTPRGPSPDLVARLRVPDFWDFTPPDYQLDGSELTRHKLLTNFSQAVRDDIEQVQIGFFRLLDEIYHNSIKRREDTTYLRSLVDEQFPFDQIQKAKKALRRDQRLTFNYIIIDTIKIIMKRQFPDKRDSDFVNGVEDILTRAIIKNEDPVATLNLYHKLSVPFESRMSAYTFVVDRMLTRIYDTMSVTSATDQQQVEEHHHRHHPHSRNHALLGSFGQNDNGHQGEDPDFLKYNKNETTYAK